MKGKVPILCRWRDHFKKKSMTWMLYLFLCRNSCYKPQYRITYHGLWWSHSKCIFPKLQSCNVFTAVLLIKYNKFSFHYIYFWWEKLHATNRKKQIFRAIFTFKVRNQSNKSKIRKIERVWMYSSSIYIQ